jgi:hypothetical protein
MKKQIIFLTVLVFTVILVAWNKHGSFTASDEVRAFNMKDIKSNNVKFIIAKKTGMTNVTAQGSNEAPDIPCWPDDCPSRDSCMDCAAIAVTFNGNSRDAFSHLTAIPEKALPKLSMQVVNETNGMIYNTLVYNEGLKEVIFSFRPTITNIANSTFKYVLNGQTIGFGHKLNKRLK